MRELNREARTQICVAEVYDAITEMEASGSPMVIPLKETLALLMGMAKDRSNVHGKGCSGWLGERVWLPNGLAPKPATVVEFTENRSTQTIMVSTGIGEHARLVQMDLDELGTTFFRTPEEAMKCVI